MTPFPPRRHQRYDTPARRGDRTSPLFSARPGRQERCRSARPVARLPVGARPRRTKPSNGTPSRVTQNRQADDHPHQAIKYATPSWMIVWLRIGSRKRPSGPSLSILDALSNLHCICFPAFTFYLRPYRGSVVMQCFVLTTADVW